MNIIGLTLYGVRGMKWATVITESFKTAIMTPIDGIRLVLLAGYLTFIMYALVITFSDIIDKKFNLSEN